MNRKSAQRHMIWSCTVTILMGTVVLPLSVIPGTSNAKGDQPSEKANDVSEPRSQNGAALQNREAKIEKLTPIEFPREKPHKFDGIDQIEFSSDGKSLFVAAHRVGNLGLLGRKPTTYWIEHWDVSNWKKRATIKDLAAPFTTVGDSKTIIALPTEDSQGGPPYGRIGKFATYDLKKGTMTRKFDVDAGYVSGLACSPDGQSVVSCSRADATNPYRWINGHVISWNINGRKQWGHHWDSVHLSVVDWSSDGSLIFGVGPGGAFAWNTELGATAWERNDHANNVESLACSDDGRYVVTGSYSNPALGFGLLGRLYSEIKIRNAKDGKPIRTVKLYHQGVVRPLDLAIDPDGRSIAVALGSYNRGQKWGEVRIVDIESGETTATLLKNHPQPITSVAYSPNGQFIAAGTADGLLKLWEIRPDDQNVIEGVLADGLSEILLGNDFLDGLGEAITQELREKLELNSEMEWKLFQRVDNHFPSEIFDEDRAVLFVQLILPSNQPQRSKTIILNTADDSTPFLKLTRSYKLVTHPTAILTAIESRPDTKRPVSHEVSLIWKGGRWIKVKRDTIERTIE
ncbi:WD domain, G-beta repeat [Gimesia alba]|uniref:WD domain, G-beta repeat n=1 Tax=Gimesia alba TaxID=2527973 RepID=A0A517RIE0_9PLAN|nr:hypothetical protein [Gimesia alba]QDT43644.1 WD domain, G-beta repeat [Gimesia alba]